jgi:tetratricopeptide (TPR) repeat protein
MSLQRIAVRLLLFVTITFCAFAQRLHNSASDITNSPGDLFGDPPDAWTGERPHSSWDDLDRSLAPVPSEHEPAAGGTVSVGELRQHLSRAGARLIQQGQRYADAGKHLKAIEVFQRALEETSAIAYARSLLGAEYLKIGEINSAITQLKQAVTLLPSVAANHSNLGYALCRIGDRQVGEMELREAINADRTSPKPHYLLGVLLLDRATQEARDQLLFAQNQVSGARLALAVYYAHRGETSLAEQQLQTLLQKSRLADSRTVRDWVAAVAALKHPASAFGFPSVQGQ